jgi:hypothetical protein
MQPKLYLSHDVADTLLAGNWVDLVEAALPQLTPVCSSLPGYTDSGPVPFGGATLVLGLITRQALAGASVPFELGAAWAQGCRVIPVLQDGLSAGTLTWSLDPALTVACDGPDSYLALLDGLGRGLQTPSGTPEAIVEALQQLCPAGVVSYSDVSGLRETRGSQPVSGATQPLWPISEPPPAPPASPADVAGGSERQLPSCASSFAAGRALADCLFNAEPGAALASELDVPFGGFLAVLGAPWAQLRTLEDGELWTEVVENLFAELTGDQRRVRAWYTLGYQLSNLLNLVHVEPADADQAQADLLEAFAQSAAALRQAGKQVGFDAADLTRIGAMLDNLIGPQPERDYTLIARLQNLLREHADSMDADRAA